MKKYLGLIALTIIANSSVWAEDMSDHRQLVEMPPEMKQMFLKNMRGHMESLDQLIAALADNDLVSAADIAENTMGNGHGKKRQCDDDSDHANSNSHQHSHSEHKDHKKKGFGQFMPAEMKAMGMNLHHAANEFAIVARQGDRGEAYKALSQVSASCVACHQSFQVK